LQRHLEHDLLLLLLWGLLNVHGKATHHQTAGPESERRRRHRVDLIVWSESGHLLLRGCSGSSSGTSSWSRAFR
jgi:hypothetical protein